MVRRPVVLLLFALLIPCQAIAEGSAGTIAQASGDVRFREKNNMKYEPAAAGHEIREGNWVKTGKDGWAVLLLADKSRFTLANDTELEITRYLAGAGGANATITMAQGKLRASVVKLAGKQSAMTVRSATAVAGIKGTEFLMLTRGQANVLFGNEGQVGVAGTGQESKPLIPYTMTETTRGYSPIDPVKVEPETPLAKAKTVFEGATGPKPPADWSEIAALPDIMARWNINYGHYLADSGRYDEALHVYQIALDLTGIPEIRADARLERGAVYARHLAGPEAALAEYLLLLEEYPKSAQAEIALYGAGNILYAMRLPDQARARLRQYLKEYPAGKHRSNVETLLRLMEQ